MNGVERAGLRATDELVAIAETRGRVPQPRRAEQAHGCEERAGRVERQPGDEAGVACERRKGRLLIRDPPDAHRSDRSAAGNEPAARVERDAQEAIVRHPHRLAMVRAGGDIPEVEPSAVAAGREQRARPG